MGRGDAARDDTNDATEQKSRQRRARGDQRHAIQRSDHRHRKRLQADQGHRVEGEESETLEHRFGQESAHVVLKTSLTRAFGLAPVPAGIDLHTGYRRAAGYDGGNQQSENAGCDRSHTPTVERGYADAEYGSCQPAAIAAYAVRAERVTQPLRIHFSVQDGEIGRVKHAVAYAGEHRHRQQHPVGNRQAGDQHRQGKRGHAEQQHAARAVTVDDEAGHGLRNAGDRIHDRDHQAERGVADAEFVL